MSTENVELVRTIHDGWSRGDFRAGAELLAADFEWQQHPEAVEPTLARLEVYANRHDALEAAGLSE